MFFHLPTKIFFSRNSLQTITTLPETKFIICADPFLEGTPDFDKLLSDLKNAGKEILVYTDIVPDAPMSGIAKLLSAIEDGKIERIVAIGGGSVLDSAKSARFFYEKAKGKRIPLVAIPTTSGTGSEVTDYVVIKDDETGKKTPIHDEKILPDIALLDANCVASMPPSVARDTGLDVLTHAIESYVCPEACEFTRTYSLKAIQLVCKYLRPAIKQKDPLAQEKVLYASTMAGVAFGQSGLGINHSLAHALGGKFGVPHGRANGLLLPYIMQFHLSLKEHIYKNLLDELNIEGYSEDMQCKKFIRDIKLLCKDLGLPSTLQQLGIKEQDFLDSLDEMAEMALGDICTQSNPVKVTKEQVISIYKAVYYGNHNAHNLLRSSSVLNNPAI